MIELVIFDLGRVLIEVDVDRCLGQFSKTFNVSMQEIIGDKSNGAHNDFMVGKISGEQFHELTCQHYGRHVDLETFQQMWLSMLGLPMRETISIVAALQKKSIPLAILSNVDPWHFAYCEKAIPEIQKIDKRFLSYELKMKKPDIEIFENVVESLNMPAGKCLFVDDLFENVAAAEKTGLHYIHFKDAKQLSHELKSYNISV